MVRFCLTPSNASAEFPGACCRYSCHHAVSESTLFNQLPFLFLPFGQSGPWISLFGRVVAGAAKPARTTHALLQLLDLLDLGRHDALQHELRDAVALLDGVVGVGVVEQQHLDLAAVVGVDDARARVDEVLRGEAGARRDAAVCEKLSACAVAIEPGVQRKVGLRKRTGTGRDGNTDVSIDEDLAARGHRRVLGGVEVVAGGEGAAPRGQASRGGQLLDLQRGDLLGGGHGVVGGLDAFGGRRGDCGRSGCVGGRGHDCEGRRRTVKLRTNGGGGAAAGGAVKRRRRVTRIGARSMSKCSGVKWFARVGKKEVGRWVGYARDDGSRLGKFGEY